MSEKILTQLRNNCGATLIIVAILLTILIGFFALAVDVGYLYTARNELQNIADASALAATRQLGVIYKGMDVNEQQSYEPASDDVALIKGAAKDVAAQNPSVGLAESFNLDDADIEIGKWMYPGFSVGGIRPNAVRVLARRDGTRNGPISTFFASIFQLVGAKDTDSDVSAIAVAALTAAPKPPDPLEMPVGISQSWFDIHGGDDLCGSQIKFSPTTDPDACAGWNSFTNYPPSDSEVRNILSGLISGDYEAPEIDLSDDSISFEFINGDLSNPTFDEFLSLFQHRGYDVKAGTEYEPILDADGEPMIDAGDHPDAVPLYDEDGIRLLYPDGTPRNKHLWKTSVVVYGSDACNPNKSTEIAGVAEIRLTDVLDAPEKTVEGEIVCDVADVRGTGGKDYGVMGTIPNLVQ